MRFIEAPVFTRAIVELMDDDEYRAVQLALLLRPAMGPLIRHGAGLRKIRWAVKGTGKRGGCRIIYYWDESIETFYMLYAYRKNKQEDLTADQLKTLTRLVREEFK
jgi:hypothetical protein